tara:strand:+ start:226 stop:714 length:489 start_codon:yes stop_codon:yes gene_type:complete
MKKLIVFMFSIVLLGSCGKEGCNDPDAINYDSSVTKDDGTCLYSVLGYWELQTYILDGDDITSTFSDYFIYHFDDSSYSLAYLPLGDSNYIDLRGTFTLNDSHTELTYENTDVNYNDGNGWTPVIATSTYSVNALTNETLNMSLISTDVPNVSSVELIMSKF